VARRDVAALVVCLALLVYSMFSGPKLLHLFSIASLVVLPILADRYRPLAPRVVAAVAVLAAANALVVSWRAIEAEYPLDAPATYAAIAKELVAHSAPDEIVVAPWGAFPGLFFYDDHNRYVAGMNTLFLLAASPERFDAYTQLYAGRAPHPERLLPRYFDDAHLVLVRRGVAGAQRLARQLSASPAFAELALPVDGWRLFRLSDASRAAPDEQTPAP
jgi:hypothetical protein